jgi:archaellum component FlaC
MNNKLMMLAFLLAGCGESTFVLISNEDRVAELERRAELNDQLNLMQSSLIDINTSSIAITNNNLSSLESSLNAALQQEIADRIAGDAAMQSLLDQESLAREAGDQASLDALAAAIASQAANNASQHSSINSLQAQLVAQGFINAVVQGQLALINAKFPVINNKLNSLQSQINNTNSNLSSLASDVSQLQVDLSDLTSRVEATENGLDNLSDDLADLQDQVDAEGVKVYKCNSLSSSERILKINNKFYGAMNYVTMGSVQVITGASSQSISTPLLCKKSGHDDLKLADADGDCNGSSWSPLAGTGVTTVVPSYTTASVNVVTSVKIALDVLNGSYVTTDGGPACYFTANSNNGSSTNLIQVQ